jgi:hypothetical protein
MKHQACVKSDEFCAEFVHQIFDQSSPFGSGIFRTGDNSWKFYYINPTGWLSLC